MDEPESFSSSIYYFWKQAYTCETMQELALKLQSYDEKNIETEKNFEEFLPPVWILIYHSLEREITNYEAGLRLGGQISFHHFHVIESIHTVLDKYSSYLRTMSLQDLQSLVEIALISQPLKISRVLVIWYFITSVMKINCQAHEINRILYENIC
jgi:hypothetical protein